MQIITPMTMSELTGSTLDTSDEIYEVNTGEIWYDVERTAKSFDPTGEFWVEAYELQDPYDLIELCQACDEEQLTRLKEIGYDTH